MRKGFPEVGENVIVSVIRITPYSALCLLEEYPGKEGMIHVSEVTGKWVRDIRKFVKLNKRYVAKVLKVDEEKSHINLSLKRVSKREKERKLQEFKHEERAEKMLEILAKKKGMSLEKAYEEIGFDLQEKFGNMFKAFEQAAKSRDILVRMGVPENYADLIHEIAKENIKKKEVKITAELNLKFYTGDGVERVKEFLRQLSKNHKLEVKYISAPRYLVEMKTHDLKSAEKRLREVLTRAVSSIKDGEADFKIKSR